MEEQGCGNWFIVNEEEMNDVGYTNKREEEQ
jgi:hypothetical protein